MSQQRRHAKSSTSSYQPTPSSFSQILPSLPQPGIASQYPAAGVSSMNPKRDEVFKSPFRMVNTSFIEIRRMNDHLRNLVNFDSSSTVDDFQRGTEVTLSQSESIPNQAVGSGGRRNGNRSFKKVGHHLKVDMVFVALNRDDVPKNLNLPDEIKKEQKSLYIYDHFLTEIFTELVGTCSNSCKDDFLKKKLNELNVHSADINSKNSRIETFMKKLFETFQSNDAAVKKREAFKSIATRKQLGLFRKEASSSSSECSSQEKRADDIFKTDQKSNETCSMSKISTASGEDAADQQPPYSGYSNASSSIFRYSNDDFEGNSRDIAVRTPTRLEYYPQLDCNNMTRIEAFRQVLVDYKFLLRYQEVLQDRRAMLAEKQRGQNPAVRPMSLDTQGCLGGKKPEHQFLQDPFRTKQRDRDSDDETTTKEYLENRDMQRFRSELHSEKDNISGKVIEKYYCEEENISYEGAASKPSIAPRDATESILLHHVHKLRSSFIKKNKLDKSESFTESYVSTDRHDLKPFDNRGVYYNYNHLEDEITMDWLTDYLWQKCEVILILADDKILVEDHENDLDTEFVRRDEKRRNLNYLGEFCYYPLNRVYIAFDRNNNCFLVPTSAVVEPEPTDDDWLYAKQLSLSEVRQLFLNHEANGVFLISPEERVDALTIYNLSVQYNGGVRRYRIVNVNNGDGYTIEGSGKYFTTLNELVGFYKRNRATLCTRLRKPPLHCRFSFTPSHHYDRRYNIDYDQLQRKEKIWQFDFGLVHTSYYQRKNSEVFEVLLKCLLRKSPDKVSKEDVEDFFDISDIMMDLKHENIIEFVGIVSYPYYIIVTEFVNENLKTHLKSVSHNHYNASDYHRICMQIASVLKYLELQRYVIHRKICCNSFLITASTGTVKLFNFSRARKVDSDEFVGEETDDVDVIGAAPETLKSNFYSTKTDVWSAGFTFWEVFSKGEGPFETTPLELYIAICYTGVFLEIPDSCPVGVFHVIKSCLRSKPEHRLTSAELYKTFKSTEQFCQNFQRRKPKTPPSEDDARKQSSRPPMVRSERVVPLTPGGNEAKLTSTTFSSKSITPSRPTGTMQTQNLPQQSYYGGVSVKPPRPNPTPSDKKGGCFLRDKKRP